MTLHTVPSKVAKQILPDGSVMGHKGKMHHPDGWELEHYSSYGCVAYDNRSGMSLKQVVQGTVSA